MKLTKTIVVLFCVLIIVAPVLTPVLRFDTVRMKFLKINMFSSEAGIFGWVKLYYFAVAVMALWLISLFTPGDKKIQFNRADVAMAAFLLMGFIMLLADSHRFDSKRRIIELIGSFALYFVAKNVFRRAAHKRAFLICLAISMAVVVFLGILQYAAARSEELAKNFILPPITPGSVPWEAQLGNRATSTVGNPNFLADILIFTIPIWVAGIIFFKKDGPALLMALLAVSTFVLLLFTVSWGGYAGLVLSIVAMVALYFTKRPRVKYKGTIAVAAALCVIAAGIFVWAKGGEIVGKGKGKTSEKTLVGLNSRRVLWESAGDMIKDRPLTGWGLGNFFSYSNIYISKFSTQDKYRDLWVARPEFLLRNPGRVHNEYLSLMVELGVFGLIVFLLIFGLYLYECLKGWKIRRDLMSDIFIFGVAAGIFAIWALSAISFPFRRPIAMILIFSTMGVAIQGKPWKTCNFTIKPGTNAWIPIAVPIVALAFYLACKNTITAVCLWKYNAAMRELNSGEGKLSKYPSDKVINNLLYCADRWHTNHEVYFQSSANLLFLNRLDEAEKALKRLEYVQPYHEKVHYYWGEYWRKLGNRQKNKGDTAKANKHYDKAIEEYKKAVRYEARYITPQVLLAETYLKQGKLDEAQEVIRTALEYEQEAKDRLDKRRKEAEKLGRIPSAHLEDLLFYWLHNAQLVIYAVNGELKKANDEFQIVMRGFRPADQITGLPSYTFLAAFPIFKRNSIVARNISAKKRPEDITEWTRRFRGASEWNEYDTLDRMHRNSLLGAHAAMSRWDEARREYRGEEARSALEEANDKFEKALTYLHDISDKFNTEFVTCDGISARETNNRIGLIYLQMYPPEVDRAIEAFNRSRAKGANENVTNYNIIFALQLQAGNSGILFLDVRGEREIKLAEAMAWRAEGPVYKCPIHPSVQQVSRTTDGTCLVKGCQEKLQKIADADPEKAFKIRLQILNKYPYYAPSAINLIRLSLRMGKTQGAIDIVKQGLKLFPDHPVLIDYARQLNIPIPRPQFPPSSR